MAIENTAPEISAGKKFRGLMKEEVERCRSRKCKILSFHDAYGKLAEELEEFWEEVRKKANFRNRQNMLIELTQIASLCQRISEDLDLL